MFSQHVILKTGLLRLQAGAMKHVVKTARMKGVRQRHDKVSAPSGNATHPRRADNSFIYLLFFGKAKVRLSHVTEMHA